MMHQINKLLTALLLYLHEINRNGQPKPPASESTALRPIVEIAIRET